MQPPTQKRGLKNIRWTTIQKRSTEQTGVKTYSNIYIQQERQQKY